jgi:hypothetical protein
VELMDRNALAASGSLANGKATLSTQGLSMGSHTLTARYTGDALHLAASSSALVENVGPSKPCTGPVSGTGARALTF